MTTHRSLAYDRDARINMRLNKNETFEFEYCKVINNYYQNRRLVGDHDNKWHYSENYFSINLEKCIEYY